MMFPVFAIPVLSLAFVGWAVASRRLSDGPRRATMVATILLACGVWTLLRTGGISGDAGSDLAWRWTPTPEERLLAHASDKPAAIAPAPDAVKAPVKPLAPAEKPSRGCGKNSRRLARLSRTRSRRRRPGRADRDRLVCVAAGRSCGAGRSDRAGRRSRSAATSSTPRSSAVDDEVVACYNLTTGKPVWTHRDAARFWESNGGAGPRGTPTLSNGRVYTFGATGIVNALDAANGAVVWSRNAASDTGMKVPGWGFASSPLVVDDIVIVGAVRPARRLRPAPPARRAGSARPAAASYSSPHLVTIDGVAQVLLLSGHRRDQRRAGRRHAALGVRMADGYPIVQPALTADGDVLISVGDRSSGMRRLAVTHGARRMDRRRALDARPG